MKTEEIINKALIEMSLNPDGEFADLRTIARKSIELAQTEWKKHPQNSYANGYNKGYDDGFFKAEKAIRGGEEYKLGYERGYKNAAEFFKIHPEILLSDDCVEKKVVPFNLKKAKDGHPVCTRSGHEATYIGDTKDGHPVFEIQRKSIHESPQVVIYDEDGTPILATKEDPRDLMLKVVAKEAWINIYADDYALYKHSSKEEAIKNISKDKKYITTTNVRWYE